MKKVLKFINNKKLIISLIVIIVIIISFAITYKVINYNKNTNCLVQFESAGGTRIQSQELKKGDKVIKPESPIKEGFEFINWMYNDEEFNFDTIIYEDIILNAKWKAKEDTVICTIYFDTKGGTIINSIEVAKDSTITEPISPTKEGYTFDGWYLNNKKFDFKTKINEDIMLVAIWKKDNFFKKSYDKLKDTFISNGNNLNNQSTNNENNLDDQLASDGSNFNNISVNNENNSGEGNNSDNSSSMKYQYEKKNAEIEYGGTPTMEIGLGEKIQLDYNYGFYNYDNDKCKIIYKSYNSKVVSITSSGIAVGEKLGETYIYIYMSSG